MTQVTPKIPLVSKEKHDDAGPRRLQLAELLQGAREVIIVHDGFEYRLRITSNGKLILTK